MGVTKSNMFTARHNHMAQLMKAVAHPARLAIVEYLLEVNQCISKDIVEVLPLAQATISQHLKELKTAGLIKGEIEGNSICYCLNKSVFKEIESFLINIVNHPCAVGCKCC